MSLSRDRRATLEAWTTARRTSSDGDQLLERHLGTAKEWFPHELVPWSRGRDFDEGEAWDPETAKLVPGRAQRAVPQHPHRGQPAALLPPDQREVRQRRRVGRVEPPVDGRGRPSRDRDPRLPRGHALDRHARARAGAHAPGVDGARAEPRQHRRRHRLRRAAGARHPHLAPQHREAAQRPAGRGDHEPGRGRREPAPPLLPRLVVGGARGRSLGHGRGDRAAGAHLRDAGRRRSKTSRRTRVSSPTPASTTSPSHHDQILVPVVFKHWRIEQLQNLKAAARAGARAPREARREGRERRQAHEVAPRSRPAPV